MFPVKDCVVGTLVTIVPWSLFEHSDNSKRYSIYTITATFRFSNVSCTQTFSTGYFMY